MKVTAIQIFAEFHNRTIRRAIAWSMDLAFTLDVATEQPYGSRVFTIQVRIRRFCNLAPTVTWAERVIYQQEKALETHIILPYPSSYLHRSRRIWYIY